MEKKGQVGTGVITGTIFAIGMLVIGIIIALVVIQNLGTGTDILPSSSNTVYNESGAYLNTSRTSYTLANAGLSGAANFVILAVNNATADGVVVNAANYSISATGVLAPSAAINRNFTSINVSYSYSLDSRHKAAVRTLEGNYTSGIDNISGKLPTVLLILAIILILSILVVLVAYWQRMNLGGNTNL